MNEDRTPTDFSVACRIIVMGCMGFACGWYLGWWGVLVALPVSVIGTMFWLRFVDKL